MYHVKKAPRPLYLHGLTFIPAKIDNFIPHFIPDALLWRHNGCNGLWNHQCLDCLLNCLFKHRSNETSKSRVTGLCEGNSPGEFPAQKASNAENVSSWWSHHVPLLGLLSQYPLTIGKWVQLICILDINDIGHTIVASRMWYTSIL